MGMRAPIWMGLLALLIATPSSFADSAREPGWVAVGPPGGSVRSLAVDPSSPNRVYLGTPQGVLYRSDDQGVHWRRLDPGFPRRGCSLDQIVVDPRGTVYVGFWEVVRRGGGVARSADHGTTFEVLKGMDGESVRALAIAPSKPTRLAAGTLTGVFVSDDAGQSWKRISPANDANLRNVASLAFDPADPQVLFAGTWHLAWKTTDGGASWSPVHRGMVDDSHVMTLNIDRRNGQNLFATCCTGVYRSNDGGAQWTKLEGIPESSRRTRSFVQNPEDSNILLAGTTEGLWISEDYGRAWRLATGKDLVINAMILQTDGTILLGTEEEGVLRSADRGRTWSASNEGFTERFVSGLLFDRANGRVIAAVWGARPSGGVYVASGSRGPWSPFGQGLEGRQVLSLAMLDHTLFAGTDDGIFARASDGASWTRANGSLGDALHLRVTEITLLDKDRLLAATSDGLMIGSDGGAKWTRADAEPTGEVYALTASAANPSQVLVAAQNGFFRSDDGAKRWKRVAGSFEGAIPHALAFLPAEDHTVLATTSGGLARSQDGGASWEWVAGGMPRCDLTALAVSPDGRTVLASDFTRGGVFRSVDGGKTWNRMATRGLVSDRVWSFDFDPSDPTHLFAASPAGGLCLLESSGASASSAEAVVAPVAP